MRKNINPLKIAIVAIFSSIIFSIGCKKSQVETSKDKITDQSNIIDSNKVSIETLKKYFANRINVSIDQISYDEKTEQFIFRGVNQISRHDLTESYIHNFLNQNN